MRGLWKGYDTRSADPGTVESMDCSTCGATMNVERNVNSATSWAEGMGGHTHLHDRFTCPHAGTDWHIQVRELLQAAEKTPSAFLEAIYRKEIASVIEQKTPTKKVSAF